MPIPSVAQLTGEPQTLDEVLGWHGGIVEAVIDQRASVARAIQTGSVISSRFLGMTADDVEDYYDSQRRELDRMTMLSLVASAEATIRLDYFRRVREKLKDPLSREYQKFHSQLAHPKTLRPDFDEGGILDALKRANVMNNHIVGRFRECLRPRHWMSHGRYWTKPAEVDDLDPIDVYGRASTLLSAIP